MRDSPGLKRRPPAGWTPLLVTFLPITALDAVLFVVPMLVMGIASVLVIREFHVSFQLTTENYSFFLGSPLYLRILGKTILIAAAVTVGCLILAFPFAYLLTKLPRSVQK